MEKHRLFIDGERVAACSKQFIPVYSPANGERLAEISRGNAEDIDRAVRAAGKALAGEWGRLSATERGRILTRMAELTLARLDRLAEIEAKDTGKPHALAQNDIRALARYFEFYGGAADKIHGEVIPYLNGYSVNVINEPCGVVAHIIPWNYPAQMLGRTIAPALAMGNASVLKPAEEACLCALEFAAIATEAGLPPGALNIVTGLGDEAGQALSAHPGVNMITFTGSPEVGARVQAEAAKNYVKCVLELGGKSPQIVFDDADLAKAVPVIVNGIIQNSGQTCSAGSRVLAQAGVAAELKAALKTAFEGLTAGPAGSASDLGPIITQKQFECVRQTVAEAKQRGAPILAEGRVHESADRGGNFIAPVIFGPLAADDPLAREEIFGPVLTVLEFATEAEAVALANGVEYGLVAGVWTENGARQQRLAPRIRTGQVFVNCFGAGGGVELPFGGVGKSGHGREKGLAALREFCVTKTIVNHYE